MNNVNIPSVSVLELELLQWLRNLPCGHRAMLESALIAAAADIDIITVSRKQDTAAAWIGAVQGKLLQGLAERLHGLANCESADSAIVGGATQLGRVYELCR